VEVTAAIVGSIAALVGIASALVGASFAFARWKQKMNSSATPTTVGSGGQG
jgi:hypothetical protein